MIKQYIVDITDDALADMEQLYYYIALKLQAPDNALGQYNRIADAIMTLDNMPERYPIMDSKPEQSRGLRLMPIDNYSVIYIVKDDRVIVTNVLYSASNIQLRLKK